ncbi:hypothetical protein BJX99DRAFT_223271, partial [Aspergillus californicus]
MENNGSNNCQQPSCNARTLVFYPPGSGVHKSQDTRIFRGIHGEFCFIIRVSPYSSLISRGGIEAGRLWFETPFHRVLLLRMNLYTARSPTGRPGLSSELQWAPALSLPLTAVFVDRPTRALILHSASLLKALKESLGSLYLPGTAEAIRGIPTLQQREAESEITSILQEMIYNLPICCNKRAGVYGTL